MNREKKAAERIYEELNSRYGFMDVGYDLI